MILTVQFEKKETVPPAVWNQLRRALVSACTMYGIQPQVREDRSAEEAAHQRFWMWLANEQLRENEEAK